MKSAKEMFEDLGYEKVVTGSEIRNENFITYNNEKENKLIGFRKWFKDFHAFEDKGDMDIDMPTFKAIHKQLEELGWLEE